MRMLWQGPSRPLAWWWASPDVGQHRQCRALVPALSPVLHGADGDPWRRHGHRAHAIPLRSLRVWLRLQVGSPARGRSTNLLVRYLAIERCHRPVRGDRGGDLVRSPMGHRPAPAGWDSRSGHHLDGGLDRRAADRRRAVLLVVRRVDDQLSGQCDREFDMGSRLPLGWHCRLPVAAGVRGHRSLGPRRRNHRDCRAIWLFS